jgi:hypothetical protein
MDFVTCHFNDKKKQTVTKGISTQEKEKCKVQQAGCSVGGCM